MQESFWKRSLDKPIIGLSPMDGVTDAAFRFMVAKYGKPSLIMTEFTSVEGIRAGALRLLDDFLYSEIERPIIAQLFGSDPEAFYIGALVACHLDFDGIDINMGCPAKNITDRGAGASLIGDPKRAQEIIRQVKLAVSDYANGKELKDILLPEEIVKKVQERVPTPNRRELPVSVKTRIGIDQVVITDWVQTLLEMKPAAITIHGRTLKQLYTGFANYQAISEAAAIIRQTPSLVLGNGDIASLADAHQHIQDYGLDGVLIGRASDGNPWVFQGLEVNFDTRMRVALEHARYLNNLLPGKGFIRIRKHLLDYCKGEPGARELRISLMRVTTLEDVEAILAPWS